jgi:hypothetical protein
MYTIQIDLQAAPLTQAQLVAAEARLPKVIGDLLASVGANKVEIEAAGFVGVQAERRVA